MHMSLSVQDREVLKCFLVDFSLLVFETKYIDGFIKSKYQIIIIIIAHDTNLNLPEFVYPQGNYTLTSSSLCFTLFLLRACIRNKICTFDLLAPEQKY